MEINNKEDRYNIRVLDRAISVLSVLSDGRPRTLTELNQEIALNTSTTFRLLATLTYHRYLERDSQSGKYSLGLACLELARAYHKGNDLRRQALPELAKLRDETAETVHLAVLEQMEVIYLEKLQGHHAIGLMSSRVGGRSPAYCTGLGKVMLAYVQPDQIRAHFEEESLRRYTDKTVADVQALLQQLEQIRRQGYGLDRGEHEADVRGVAAPIFDHNQQVVAAINVSGPAGRLEPIETNYQLIEQTRRTAGVISAKLGYTPTIISPGKEEITTDQKQPPSESLAS